MKIGVLGLLGVLFVGLKLTEYIDWSWWYVLMPFYIVPGCIVAFLVVFWITAFLALFMHCGFEKWRTRK